MSCRQRFGRVEFGPAQGDLVVAGKRVKLDRVCRAILAVLVENAGTDVSKDRLFEAAWPGRVVGENSLAKAVSRLRKALGADGDNLETIHGFGYRLTAEVDRIAPDSEPAQMTAGPRLRRHVLLSIAAAGLAALALGYVWVTDEARSGGSAPVRNGEAPGALGRVLWVDDHPQNNVAEVSYLEDRRIAVYQVGTTQEALTLLPMYQYGAVISDMGRGERPLAGIDLLEAMRARGDDRPFFLYTVHSSDAQRQLVAEAGGQGVAETRDELYAAILPLFHRVE